MRLTRVAAGAGILLLGLLCWLAAAGLVAAREGLVTVFALFVLVAGGNWLSGRSTRARDVPPRPAGVAEAPPQCPGAALARRRAPEGAAGGPSPPSPSSPPSPPPPPPPTPPAPWASPPDRWAR